MTADKISTIVKAASVNVEAFYPGLFASFLEAKPLGDLISNVGGGGGDAAPAAAGDAPAGGEAKEEKKAAAAAPSEEDEDMGFGLFD